MPNTEGFHFCFIFQVINQSNGLLCHLYHLNLLLVCLDMRLIASTSLELGISSLADAITCRIAARDAL